MPIPLLQPSKRETVRKVRRSVLAVPGVRECEVLIDAMSKKPHVRVLIFLDGSLGYERAHSVSSMVDHRVRTVVPNARVWIRSEPYALGGGKGQVVWELVRKVADHEPGSRGAHNIHVEDAGENLGVDFHFVVSAGLTPRQGREVASRVEKKLKESDPRISEVVVHVETTADSVRSEWWGHGSELRWYVEHVVERFPEVRMAGPPLIRRVGEGQLSVKLRVYPAPGSAKERVEQATPRLRAAIKEGFEGISAVEVVLVPEGPAGAPRA